MEGSNAVAIGERLARKGFRILGPILAEIWQKLTVEWGVRDKRESEPYTVAWSQFLFDSARMGPRFERLRFVVSFAVGSSNGSEE